MTEAATEQTGRETHDTGSAGCPHQQGDVRLARWSVALMAMVLFAAALNIAEPINQFFFGLIGLVKDNGDTVWTTKTSALQLVDRIVFVALTESDNIIWIYALLQIWKLARYYRNSQIFEERNAICFIRMGIGLCIMGVVQSFEYIAVAQYFFWRGISPWLADMPPFLFVIRADLLMAGVFFFVLGKIMRRAVELEENNRLIV